MKKSLFLVLCLIIAFSFVACDNNEDTSLKCTKCGEPISDNAKFCSGCGSEIITSNGDNKDFQCPYCNKMIYSDSKFCSECGSTLDGSNDSDEKDNNELENIDFDVLREQMSNFCNNGMYSVYDGWIYSLNFPENGGSGLFSKMRTDRTDYSIITAGTPNFISIDGEYIYFVMAKDNGRKLYRCRLGGNDLTQLVDSNVWYLQVAKDCLYYNKYDVSSGKTLGFYKSNKDGTKEELILNKEIYYSFVVGDDLYYQDDGDNEKIHKFSLSKKTDETITSGISYSFVIDENVAYYIKNTRSTGNGNHSGALVKIDLNTKAETLLYNGVYTSGIAVSNSSIYFINTNDNNRIYSIGKDGENIKLISQDDNCAHIGIFDNKIIYSDFDENQDLIEAIYVCNLDGSNKIRISKN